MKKFLKNFTDWVLNYVIGYMFTSTFLYIAWTTLAILLIIGFIKA